ncbi:MAG: dTMP kinase [Alphaproteobacteria bacterium]|nr:dTMP kinase [Alphaproteobacteria bacterium]
MNADAAKPGGRFITFEGGEGAGKSTQARLLVDALKRAGIDALATREPGGSPGAEAIRTLLLGGGPDAWDAETEALLVVAARRDHVVRVIRPALESGRWVVCDRFADSTLAYQGFGHGLSLEHLRELHRFVCQGFHPDLTLILDLPVEVGLKRASDRNRFERMGRDFHERMRQGFLAIAQHAPERCVLIDATGDIESVRRAVVASVRDRLGVGL